MILILSDNSLPSLHFTTQQTPSHGPFLDCKAWAAVRVFKRSITGTRIIPLEKNICTSGLNWGSLVLFELGEVFFTDVSLPN